MRTINIMSGIPGCGKSTYIRHHKSAFDLWLCRDSYRDSLREFLKSDKYFPVSSNEENRLWAAYLNTELAANPELNVYIDQTTLGVRSLEKLLHNIRPSLDSIPSHLVLLYFDTPLDICLENNRQRSGFEKLKDQTIYQMAHAPRIKPNDCIKLNVEFKHIPYEHIS